VQCTSSNWDDPLTVCHFQRYVTSLCLYLKAMTVTPLTSRLVCLHILCVGICDVQARKHKSTASAVLHDRPLLEVIEVVTRFNDLKPFIWTGAYCPSSVQDAVRAVEEEHQERVRVAGGATEGESAALPSMLPGYETAVRNKVVELERARSGVFYSIADTREHDEVELIAPIHPVGSLNLNVFVAEVAASGHGADRGVSVLPEDCPALYDELVSLVRSREALSVSFRLATERPRA
jgi:hypothetical protein